MRFAIILLLVLFLYKTSDAQNLKVISYNIHHGADKGGKLTLDQMGSFISSSRADLVGLQEVDSMCNRSGKIDQMKQLAAITGMYYKFVRHFAYDGGAYGLGMLSRYPISDIRNDRITSLAKMGKKGSLALLSAKVTLGGKKEILFSTVHFALDQPTRMIQSAEVLTFLKADIPVILTGDLNAEPDKKEVEQLSTFFSSTDPVAGAYTFPVYKPVKKIDYIFVSSKDLKKVISCKVLDDIHHSDHLPLTSRIRLGAH